MADFIDPFDFQKILVDLFIGNQALFVFVFVVVFSFVAAKFQMSNRIFFVLLTVGSVLFGLFLGEAYFILIIFIIGLLTFKSIARIVTD